jgi:hypothetical protein
MCAVDELPLEVRGSEPPRRGPVVSLGSPRRPGLFVVVALVVVVALAVAIGSHRSSGRGLPTTTASVRTTPETTARATTTSSIVSTTATTVVERTTTTPPQASQVIYLNQPSLPSQTHTELLVHGAYGLDRTDIDQGRTISTRQGTYRCTVCGLFNREGASTTQARHRGPRPREADR